MDELTAPKTAKDGKKRTKARKIYDVVSTSVVLLLFVFLAVTVIAVICQRKAGNDVSVFGYSIYFVPTNSMEPTINVGDIIATKEVKDVNTLKAGEDGVDDGDVITFIAPSGTLQGYKVTHRINAIEYAADGVTVVGIKTKGDNAAAHEDGWTLSPDAVKGVYVRTLSVMSAVVGFMMSGFWGYFVCIVLPIVVMAALFAGGYIVDRAKLKKTEPSNVELSEEEKAKLAEEYLAKLQGDAKAKSETTDTPTEDSAKDGTTDRGNGNEKDGAKDQITAENMSLNNDDKCGNSTDSIANEEKLK